MLQRAGGGVRGRSVCPPPSAPAPRGVAPRRRLPPVQPRFPAPCRREEHGWCGNYTGTITPLLPRMGRDFSPPPPPGKTRGALGFYLPPFPPGWGWPGLAAGGGKVAGRAQCRARCLFCINMAVALASDRDKPCALRPCVPAKQFFFRPRRLPAPPVASPPPPPPFPYPARAFLRG